MSYPVSALRTLALQAQGLAAPGSPEISSPGSEALFQVVEQLGCVQIDTLQMVHRSHYLVLWSRLGRYDPAELDRLIYDPQLRLLFEGWQHAACLVPLKDYRFQLPQQRSARDGPGYWFREWLENPENARLLPLALERIRQEGALRASDFEYDGPKRGSWWDWKPAKTALEHLYAFGDLMIAGRSNFQRVYDLTERVLPAWVVRTEPSLEERDRYWIDQSARALGVFQPGQAADYAYRKRNEAKAILDDYIARGIFVPVEAETAVGETTGLFVHKDCSPWLEQAADGALKAERTTFLSPFDNLFWGRGRDELLWGFRHTLEAYKPESQRKWGYYNLPILHRERLVGRFDPKLERQTGVLRLKALYLEPGVDLDEELLQAVAGAMRSFMEFHQAKDFVIERSQPSEVGEKLAAALAGL